MRVNQMRLWLASLAYVLIARLRKWGLQETEWARAQIWTLRSKLLKIGALVKVSVRRVLEAGVLFASGLPSPRSHPPRTRWPRSPWR